ncbi:glycosyltransferase LafA [Lentilactobacillus kosonis]|uniref:Glycosyltransferase LafA n=1 Tax=Lentilactobacillus kosonis TaxID=2810561 RepID=A0A401FPV8_9LACO|nr:glycosyltransferase LafA [Lentilactobacillus kosonis]
MNIGIFTDTYFPQVSGVATSIKTLKNELKRQGHQVYILRLLIPTLTKISLKRIFLDFQAFHLFRLQIEESLLEVYFKLMKSLKSSI